ncbi:hypothetical protein C8R46DRAFT_1044790 [Mycena filopes]|nr:hypothetical protein C8R46DRAFT_1044790 [Mycena filopes]
MYHYLSGIMGPRRAQRWAEAEEYFEICFTAPGVVPAALQLISRCAVSLVPKYAHAALSRILKKTVYDDLIGAYPQNSRCLHALLDKEKPSTARRGGRSRSSPRRYVMLGLGDIACVVGISSEDKPEVRALILSMIETGDISAQIISDTFTEEEVDTVLYDAQRQSELLGMFELELETARSRESITKSIMNPIGTILKATLLRYSLGLEDAARIHQRFASELKEDKGELSIYYFVARLGKMKGN